MILSMLTAILTMSSLARAGEDSPNWELGVYTDVTKMKTLTHVEAITGLIDSAADVDHWIYNGDQYSRSPAISDTLHASLLSKAVVGDCPGFSSLLSADATLSAWWSLQGPTEQDDVCDIYAAMGRATGATAFYTLTYHQGRPPYRYGVGGGYTGTLDQVTYESERSAALAATTSSAYSPTYGTSLTPPWMSLQAEDKSAVWAIWQQIAP